MHYLAVIDLPQNRAERLVTTIVKKAAKKRFQQVSAGSNDKVSRFCVIITRRSELTFAGILPIEFSGADIGHLNIGEEITDLIVVMSIGRKTVNIAMPVMSKLGFILK